MKKHQYLFPIVLLLAISMVGCQKSKTTSERKTSSETKESIQIALAGYNFPLIVDQVVKKTGTPTRTYIDKSEGCSVGQMHYWNNNDKNYILLVVGDNDEEKVDYLAGSRLFGVSKLMTDKPCNFDGPLEIRLDDSGDEVKRKLESFVMKNPTFSISQSDYAFSPLRFFCQPDHFKLQYVLKEGDSYMYFIINKKNTVEAIVKATFDVLAAC